MTLEDEHPPMGCVGYALRLLVFVLVLGVVVLAAWETAA